MKILVVFTHRDVLASTANRILALLPELARRAEVGIVAPDDAASQALVAGIGVRLVQTFHERRIAGRTLAHFSDHNLSLTRSVRSAAKAFEPDVVYVPFPWGVRGIARAVHPLPVVVEANNVEGDLIAKSSYPWVARALLRFYVPWQERRALGAAGHIVTVSRHDAERIAARYDIHETHITTVPVGVPLLGVPTDVQRLAAKAALGLAPDKVHAVFHGTMMHPPNQVALLELSRMAAKLSSVRLEFVVAGRGLAAAPPGLTNLGFVPVLANLLRAADLAVVPITSGSGTRTKMVEYLGAGIPMVCTAVSARGLDLQPGKHAFVLPAVDDLFAEDIERLANDQELRHQMGNAAFALAQAQHSIPGAATKLLAVLGRYDSLSQ